MADYYECVQDWALPGDTVLLYNDVQNIGGADVAQPFYVDHYLYDYSVNTEWYLGARPITSLDSGAVNVADSLATLPSDLFAGTYWLGCC